MDGRRSPKVGNDCLFHEALSRRAVGMAHDVEAPVGRIETAASTQPMPVFMLYSLRIKNNIGLW